MVTFSQLIKSSTKQSFSLLSSIGLSLTSLLLAPNSLQAAEKIFFVYSPVSATLNVSSLEAFARDGTIDKNLEFYLNLTKADAAQQAKFREALTKPIPIDPIILSRLLKTDEGERLLEIFGRIINIQGGGNGKYALRGAIVTAALDEEGLTLLNFLRQLPVDIQLDLKRANTYSQDVEVIIKGTEYFVNEIAQLSAQETAQAEVIDYSQLPDLRQPGPYEVEQETWQLNDPERDRQFYALVHRPKPWRNGKTPVIIFSHGWTATPEEYAKDAQRLASYGFFTIQPQHPGSDDSYAKEFAEGFHSQIADLNDFIDRPLDITFTLDELERRNASEFGDRLELEHVGMFGHSLGGYTALAIAGATPAPNFAMLETDCNRNLGQFNNALLLQCRALNLPRESFNFRDERVQAVVAGNPVNASILGEAGMGQIQIPIAIGAGSYDPATPFIFEQVRSFPWLTATNRYLFLAEGQTHVDLSVVDGGGSQLLSMIPNLQLPDPQLLNDYTNALRVAFFQVYVAKNENYRPYLSPAYAAYLSAGEQFKSFLITAESTEPLAELIEQFKQDNKGAIRDVE